MTEIDNSYVVVCVHDLIHWLNTRDDQQIGAAEDLFRVVHSYAEKLPIAYGLRLIFRIRITHEETRKTVLVSANCDSK